MGNLTRDPELRYIPSGQPVASFTIAVNRAYNSQSGEKKEEVCFVRVVAWAKLAEIANEYLKKGSPVFVEGRLQSRSWEAQDGTKRSTLEVVAQSVQFLPRGSGSRGEEAAVESEGSEFQEPATKAPSKKGGVPVSENELQPDDEIPF